MPRSSCWLLLRKGTLPSALTVVLWLSGCSAEGTSPDSDTLTEGGGGMSGLPTATATVGNPGPSGDGSPGPSSGTPTTPAPPTAPNPVALPGTTPAGPSNLPTPTTTGVGGESSVGNGGAPSPGPTAGGASGGTTEGGAGMNTVGGSAGVAGGGASTGIAGDTGMAGDTGVGGSDTGPIPNQDGNPAYGLLNTYLDWLSGAGSDDAKLAEDRTLADNMLSWQMPHGGFDKHDVSVYAAPWNGTDRRSGWSGEGGIEIGTIDNNGTVTQLMFLADVYQRSGVAEYREGASRALDFLLDMPYPSGGIPQVYPARAGASYSNYVTFNDDAMVRALMLLHQVVYEVPPLDGDVFTAEQRQRAASVISGGIDYIVASQIVQSGTKTVWCAQHDPVSYEPRGARSYEHPSKSGSESIGVVAFLLTQPQTPQVDAAVRAAIAWYKSEAVQLENTRYVSRPSGNTDDNYNPIQSSSGDTMWCRFYDVDQDVCFFSGRAATDDPPGNGKQYDIMAIEAERRYGYQWGGAYGGRLFPYTDGLGY